MSTYVISIVRGDTYTELAADLSEGGACFVARGASKWLFDPIVVQRREPGLDVEVARYESGDRLIRSEETETVQVLVTRPGAS